METPSPESFLTLQKNSTGLTNLTRFNDKFDKEFIVFKNKIQDFIINNNYHPLEILKNSRNIAILWDCIDYAQQIHSDQTRSDKKTLYFHHVMEVASGFMDSLNPDMRLEEAIFGIKVCICHDLVEDQADKIYKQLFPGQEETDILNRQKAVLDYVEARFGGVSKYYSLTSDVLEKLTKPPKTAKYDNEQKINLDSLKNAKSDLFELTKARYLERKHLDYFEHFLEIINNPEVFLSKLWDVKSNSFDIDTYKVGADKYLSLIRVFIIVLEVFQKGFKESDVLEISSLVEKKLQEGIESNFILANRSGKIPNLQPQLKQIIIYLHKNNKFLSILDAGAISDIIKNLKNLEVRGLQLLKTSVENKVEKILAVA